MHPAISVIFFTVTSGAGYGLLIWLAGARWLHLSPGITSTQILAMGAIGVVLVTAGLISSTFHLANPINAWRSFTRFRTSWLSREAVFAVLFYPVVLGWLFCEWLYGDVGVTRTLAVFTALFALIVLICTAMIYASLKTIRQWHTALTPVNFLLLGLSLGSLFWLAMLQQQNLPISTVQLLALLTIALAGLVKIIYFGWIGQPAGPTINTALGFTRATVKLLDVGHTAGTFLTDEFGYQVERVKLMWLRLATLVFAFGLPLVLLSGVLGPVHLAHLVLAAIVAYAGVFVERWLFFAEARHVVMLYHGQQRT